MAYTDLNEAVGLVADEATIAKCNGTFSVGGALFNSVGELIYKMHNTVVEGNLLSDPTAHGERQLVDWYFSQPPGSLPPPSEITLVTSLDPCCMCTGAILTAGFKVVVAANDTFAGINYDVSGNLSSLPSELRTKALDSFSYPEVVADNCYSRPASVAAVPPVFQKNKISGRYQALCDCVFLSTLNEVKDKINTDLLPDQFLNVTSLPPNHPIVLKLKKYDAYALDYTGPQYKPNELLAQFLQLKMQIDTQMGGPGHAVALLDYYGNLLHCAAGNYSLSKIKTAFMECTRAYAKIRKELEIEGVSDYKKYLMHPKYCTFVLAVGTDYTSQSFMDLGAYGSTMEGEIPSDNPYPFQYVRSVIPQAEINSLCESLPTLYSAVIKVNPVQVENQRLIQEIG
jgi:tRNA(Arg) A34 adenosine deaminase TadA